MPQRNPAAYTNPATNAREQAPMTKEEERAAFFANNPVMRQMQERQKSGNLPVETVPPKQPLGGGAREQYRPGEQEALKQAVPATPSQMQPQQRQISPSMLAGYKQQSQQPQRSPMADGTNLMMRGYEQQKQGAIMEQAAQASAAETEAEAMREAYEETLDANSEATRQMEEVNQQVQEVKERAVALQSQMAEKKIDPDRFWNSRTTGQKVMLGIGTFLSGLGGGGNNQVLDMIDTAIQRDIAAQQENYERMGERANNMVSMMSSLYKPGFEAAKMARVMALENIKNKLAAKRATTKSQAHQAAIPKIIGQIEEEQGKEMNKVVMDRLKAQKDSKKDTKLNSEQMKRLQFYKNGIEAVRGMKKALEKGVNTFSLVGDNEFTLNRSYYVDSFRAGTGAAMPPYEIEFYQALAPKVTDREAIQKKKLEKAEQTLKRQISDIEKNYGMEPGTHLQSADPRVKIMEP